MQDTELIEIVQQIKLVASGRYISTAESCTGGLLASYLTSIEGSSNYFSTGIVSYSNDAKRRLLNVSSTILEEFGAVSEEVAKEMAIGAINISGSDIAVSITGIAGPGGGSKSKPVGMVCFGLATSSKLKSVTHNFSGTRAEIRKKSCEIALKLILESLLST